MGTVTDTFDLAPLQLLSGQGRRFDLEVTLPPFVFGEDTYPVSPQPTPVVLDVSKTTHNGYALRLRFSATLTGPCMRCLTEGSPTSEIDAREVDQPGGESDELTSPYMHDDVLDVGRWAIDALTLALPPQILCKPDCQGLCPECGIDLNTAEPGHHHDKGPDPRWAKLAELKFEES